MVKKIEIIERIKIISNKKKIKSRIEEKCSFEKITWRRSREIATVVRVEQNAEIVEDKIENEEIVR